MGIFSFLLRNNEKDQLYTSNAREKAYAMSVDQLIKQVYSESDDSIAVKAIYCQELSQKIKGMSDSMLENNYKHYSDKNMSLKVVMGNELVERGIYKNIGSGSYVRI